MSIREFVENNNFKFNGVNTVKTTKVDGEPDKDIIGIKKNWGWEKKTYEDCVKMHKKDSKSIEMNMLMISTDDPKYVIFDMDEPETNKHFKALLKENGLYNRRAVTPSFKHVAYDLKYKNHYWFEVDPKEFEASGDINAKQFAGWDLRYGKAGKRTGFIMEWPDSKISNLPKLTLEHFNMLYDDLHTAFPMKSKKVAKPVTDKPVTEKPLKTNPTAEAVAGDTLLERLFYGIDAWRWDDFENWDILAKIFVNENLDMQLFHECSKRSDRYGKKFDKQANLKHISSLRPNSMGYKLTKAFKMLREDNYDLFKELQVLRLDFWEFMENFDHVSIANHYYNLKPDSYVFTTRCGWYEYGVNNIVINHQKNPPSLIVSILEETQRLIDEQKGFINLADPKYLEKTKLLKRNYHQAGLTATSESVMKLLQWAYTNDDFDDLLDRNKNLCAFRNKVYDYETSTYRDIKKNDYISLTTGYNINEKSNPTIRAELIGLINSIFKNQESIDYWAVATANSLFYKAGERMFIHTGEGGNGKGLLGKLTENAFGGYFMTVENTFFTGKVKQGAANSSLAQARGKRLILSTEPASETDICKLNIDMVKLLTGGDTISARELFKAESRFKPTFTCHMQCNAKPDLGVTVAAIARRIKVIPYIYKFVDRAPLMPHEKRGDEGLKDKLEDQKYVNEYMLYMLEVAKRFKGIPFGEVPVPEEAREALEEYLDENNQLKAWMDREMIFTEFEKDTISYKDLLERYMQDNAGDTKYNRKTIVEAINFNGLKTKIIHKQKYVVCAKFKDAQ